MEAEIYPEPRVDSFISRNLNAVRLHVKKHPEAMARFSVNWTPTVLVLDSNGAEQHRIEGFLPADDFLAQLQLGLAHAAFRAGRFEEAERRFREIVKTLPNTEAAAEAQYWAGVARYKANGNADALKETAAAFKQQYSDTSWAKKASIWG